MLPRASREFAPLGVRFILKSLPNAPTAPGSVKDKSARVPQRLRCGASWSRTLDSAGSSLMTLYRSAPIHWTSSRSATAFESTCPGADRARCGDPTARGA